MSSYTIIIPSAKAANVARCVAAIREHRSLARIIVVADGIPAAERPALPGVEWIEGAKPFCFARNVNLGIRAAGTDDVILCNDDALLRTRGGFNLLRQSAARFGIVSPSISGRCVNPRQQLTTLDDLREPQMLAFVCVYLRRATIDRIGLLDEQFTVGTWEDNDYCRRALAAGLSLGICGACRMHHGAEHATLSARDDYPEILAANEKLYVEKWGSAPPPLESVSPGGSPLLSVLICTIPTRADYLGRLLTGLAPQIATGAELLLASDAGEVSIGQKRQRLLEAARGEFVVFIDDDDTVASDYVARLLDAIRLHPAVDCITFRSQRYCDGTYEADCIYSLENSTNDGCEDRDGVRTYIRWPYHVTPIRRELALQAGFEPLDHREDTGYAERIRPLLRSEVHLPEVLYSYWYRSDRSAEVTHKSRTADGFIPPPAPAFSAPVKPALKRMKKLPTTTRPYPHPPRPTPTRP